MSKPWTESVIGSQPTLQILYTCTIRYTPKQTPLPPCILCIVWEQNQPCVLLLRMMIACLPRVLISGSHKDQLMQVEVRSNCNGSIQWKISYLHWKSTMENRVLMKWKCWRWWASIPIASICCPQYFIVCNIAHSECHVTVCYNVYTVIDLSIHNIIGKFPLLVILLTQWNINVAFVFSIQNSPVVAVYIPT